MPIKTSVFSQIHYYFTRDFGVLEYNSQHVDIFKLNLIDYEFFMGTFENLLDVIHLGKLLHIRGWSLCLFDIAFIGKSAFFSLQKIVVDLVNFFEYKVFVTSINKSLPTVNLKDEKEICPVCQEYMLKGVKLRCSHIYH
jgi:hypothetical protein